MKTLIIYHTKTGHTLEAINPVVEALNESGGYTEVVLAEEFKNEMIEDFNSLIVASPCWAGSSGITGVAFPLVSVLKKLPEDCLKDKFCGGIAIHAKIGGAGTLQHIKKLLSNKGCTHLKFAPVVKAGVLMSLYKGPSVKKEDEILLRKFGNEFVLETSKTLKQ